MMADSRQVELVAVRTQIEELKGRVGDAEKEFASDADAADAGARRIRDRDARTDARRAAASKI